jgi:hypothetical protein
MGQQVGDMFASLGDVLSNPEATAKGASILANELRLYAQYLVYMQSLKPWQYSLLPQNDRYIRCIQLRDGAKSYFLELLISYNDVATDKEFADLVHEIQAMGVDFGVLPLREYGLSAATQADAAATTGGSAS